MEMKVLRKWQNNSVLENKINKRAPNEQRQTNAIYCEIRNKWETKQ
jgi:hypothetical protein